MKPSGPWSTKPGKAAAAASAGQTKSLLAVARGGVGGQGRREWLLPWNSLWPVEAEAGCECPQALSCSRRLECVWLSGAKRLKAGVLCNQLLEMTLILKSPVTQPSVLAQNGL